MLPLSFREEHSKLQNHSVAHCMGLWNSKKQMPHSKCYLHQPIWVPTCQQARPSNSKPHPTSDSAASTTDSSSVGKPSFPTDFTMPLYKGDAGGIAKDPKKRERERASEREREREIYIYIHIRTCKCEKWNGFLLSGYLLPFADLSMQPAFVSSLGSIPSKSTPHLQHLLRFGCSIGWRSFNDGWLLSTWLATRWYIYG